MVLTARRSRDPSQEGCWSLPHPEAHTTRGRFRLYGPRVQPGQPPTTAGEPLSPPTPRLCPGQSCHLELHRLSAFPSQPLGCLLRSRLRPPARGAPHCPLVCPCPRFLPPQQLSPLTHRPSSGRWLPSRASRVGGHAQPPLHQKVGAQGRLLFTLPGRPRHDLRRGGAQADCTLGGRAPGSGQPCPEAARGSAAGRAPGTSCAAAENASLRQ